MGEQLTDKQIRKACAAQALECPCCGSFVTVLFRGGTAENERFAVIEAAIQKIVGLEPIEKSEEAIRSQRLEAIPGTKQLLGLE